MCFLCVSQQTLSLADVTVIRLVIFSITYLQAIGPFEVFNKCPTLKFKLAWSQLPLDQSASNGAETDMENDGENNRAIVPKHFSMF